MNSVHRWFSVFLISFGLFASAIFTSPSPAQAFICLGDDLVADIVDVLPDWLADLVVTPDPWYNQEVCSFKEKVFEAPEEEIFGERYTYAQVGWIINSTVIHLLYPLFQPVDALQNLFSASVDSDSQKNYAMFGVPGILMGSMHQMYTAPPASAVHATKQVLAKFSLVKPAHAQTGYGFGAITAIQNLWTASRNMAYLFLVIFLIAAGFLVIFRIKINPQTSITVQLMIPRIITTLILITFSYAIAGFVIDMLYVILSLIISSMYPAIVSDVNNTISFFVDPGFGNIFFYYLITLGSLTILLMTTLIGWLPALILLVIVLFLLLKIWWMMMKTYIMMVILIIIAPWQIMLGLLPGQQGFGSWFRNYIAHASVFLVVPLMFLFNMILWATTSGGFSDAIAAIIAVFNYLFTLGGGTFATNNILTPGAYSFPELPLFGAHGSIFHLGVGFSILALIPKTAEMVRDALKIPAFKYGSAYGEAVWDGVNPFVRKYEDYKVRKASTEAAVYKNAGAGSESDMVAAEARARNTQRQVQSLEKTIKSS